MIPMTDRKKPGVPFWATVALVVVLVGYPRSFGPACWRTAISSSDIKELDELGQPKARYHHMMIVYWPLGAAARWHGPVGAAIRRWMGRGIRDGQMAAAPVNPGGYYVMGVAPGHLCEWIIPPSD
jgi:hypothetical protein